MLTISEKQRDDLCDLLHAHKLYLAAVAQADAMSVPPEQDQLRAFACNLFRAHLTTTEEALAEFGLVVNKEG